MPKNKIPAAPADIQQERLAATNKAIEALKANFGTDHPLMLALYAEHRRADRALTGQTPTPYNDYTVRFGA